MRIRGIGFLVMGFTALFLAACSGDQSQSGSESAAQSENAAAAEQSQVRVLSAPPADLVSMQLQAGDGATAVNGQKVTVHYSGWLFDETAEENKGKKFDSSLDRGRPFSFPLGAGRVIRGWDQGVSGMQVGEKRRLVIPPHLGYGARGAGNAIPGGATLVFDVELLVIQ